MPTLCPPAYAALSCASARPSPPTRRENFKGTEWVKVPQVLWPLSSSQVLTMEYTPGVKINRGEQEEGRRGGVGRQGAGG